MFINDYNKYNLIEYIFGNSICRKCNPYNNIVLKYCPSPLKLLSVVIQWRVTLACKLLCKNNDKNTFLIIKTLSNTINVTIQICNYPKKLYSAIVTSDSQLKTSSLITRLVFRVLENHSMILAELANFCFDYLCRNIQLPLPALIRNIFSITGRKSFTFILR